jgi:hypothetical protein
VSESSRVRSRREKCMGEDSSGYLALGLGAAGEIDHAAPVSSLELAQSFRQLEVDDLVRIRQMRHVSAQKVLHPVNARQRHMHRITQQCQSPRW